MDVESWFATNKFAASDFKSYAELLRLKKKKKLRVSCVIPTLNEEKNIGPTLSVLKKLSGKNGIIDEILIIDSGSSDKTQEIVEKAGAKFIFSGDILSNYGFVKGKGENLWKSIYAANGDIIIWLDADIKNINPDFVLGIAGPLLMDDGVGFVKGFYRRALKIPGTSHAFEGGRVTELLIRPLLNLYFPRLSAFIQPLSGEYGGRRAILDKIPFFTGYGVETGMLIDLEKKFGLEAMAQVDLGHRVHRNRPIHDLSKMSFEILQAFSEKANSFGVFMNLDKINNMYTSMSSGGGKKPEYSMKRKVVLSVARPAMFSLPEYRVKFYSEGNLARPWNRVLQEGQK